MQKKFYLAAALLLAGSMAANADTMVDFTGSVGTSQSDWNASGLYTACGKVTTENGASVDMVERYYSSKSGMEVGVTPLHQTINGLPDGNYTVSLYATANACWGICGDDALSGPSQSAVTAYAVTGGKKTTTPITASNESSYSTPGTYTIEVAVSGGSLELGLEIMEANKANWYTIQIKGLKKKAASEEAAYKEMKEYCLALLASPEWAAITGEERDNLKAAAESNTTNYGQGLQDLISALTIFQNARPAYDTLAVAKKTGNEVITKYNLASTSSVDVLKSLMGLAPKDAEEALENANEIIQAYRDVAMSDAIVGIDPNAESMTDLITNPDAFEGTEGWEYDNLSTNQGEGPIYDIEEDEQYPYFDAYEGNSPLQGYSLQTIDIPAGQYRLSLLARGTSEESFEYYTLTLSGAAKAEIDLPCKDGNKGGLMGNGWNYAHIDFETTGGELTISVDYQALFNGSWVSFVDFQLTKYSLSGVENISSENNGIVKYYNLSGYEVKADRLSSGIYIKTQNGKAEKIMVK